MADKKFGVKQINLIGASGTPTLTSPNNLNINAINVAISTDLSVGGDVSIGGTFNALSVSGVATFSTDLSVGGDVSIGGTFNALSVSGVSTFSSGVDITGTLTVGDIEIRSPGTTGQGTRNIAIGEQALDNIKNGDSNVALGLQAGQYFNISDSNYGRSTIIGHQAFLNVRGASDNVAVGYHALYGKSTSINVNQVTAVGADAGYNVVNTRFSSFFGYQSGWSQTTADYNTFLGYRSGYEVTTGSDNVILGGFDGNQGGLDIRTSSNNLVLSDGVGSIRIYANSSGNVGVGTTDPTSRLTVSGVCSATSFYGDASHAVSGKWTLGANGTSNYTFEGVGVNAGNNYNTPMYLARGCVYEFVNNSGGSHPFQIRVSNGGAAYSTGVTNNGASSGTIRFEVPMDAPNSLYYQCTSHSGMGGTITVYPDAVV